jgi:polyisoprenoid-binding protein YceI
MIIKPGNYQVGPSTGKMLLRTYRRGVAQSVGHDLVIEMTSWSGQVVVGDDLAASQISGTVDMGAMVVLEGTGGVKALTEKDKVDIVDEARKHLKVAAQPQASFSSTAVQDGAAATLTGTFSVAGGSGPISLTVEEQGSGQYVVRGTVVQSAYGIKPYSAFLGALKLKDEIELEIQVALPA